MTAPQSTHAIDMKGGAFLVDGKPFFIYSGEVHYFRIPKAQWRARLKALKAAGFNTVSTYIPWIWHEPKEGEIDLTGKTLPERDVLGFLDLAREEKLRVSARVGPVSNAELVHEGIPEWLLKNYHDVFVTGNRDVGNLPHVTIISYLHPVFQEKVGRWYDALLPEVASRQATKGGAILAVQLCNEVAMVHWLQKGADYKPHVNKMYQGFLKELYGTPQALNAVYGTSYGSFDDVPQPQVEATDPKKLQIAVDWALFYRRYYATYFLTLSARARAHGIDVPLFCNIPQFYDYDVRGRGNWAPMTTSMFQDFPVLTPRLVFGGAYQMRHLDFENFHDVALTTEVTRLLNNVKVSGGVPAYDPAKPEKGLPALPKFTVETESDVPVVCAELQTGIMRDRPRLYPHQVELNVKTSVSQGLAGLNGYMLAGGVNPPGYGAFGTYHDWQSPIGPKGEIRPHMEPLKQFGRFLSWAGPLLAGTRKAVDTSFGFYLPYYGTEYWDGPWNANMEGQRTNLWYDGTARLVQLAGYSYDFVELQRTSLATLLKKPSLWVYSLEYMDRDTQKKLADYVKGGGKLFLGPRLPTVDLMGRADSSLADGLGIKLAGEQKGNRFTADGIDHWVQGPVQLFSSEGAEPLFRLPGGDAALKKSVGKGAVVAAGFGMPHVFDHFRDWVADWGRDLGLTKRVACDPWDVQAVLRENGEYGFLFVFNYHFTAREATISLALPGTGEKVKLPGKGKLHLPPFTGLVLPLNVPLGGGVRIVSCTAEPRAARASSKEVRLALVSTPGRPVELLLAVPGKVKSVKAGKKKLPATVKKGRLLVSFTAEAAETEVVVGL